jgi:hypothetical protein
MCKHFNIETADPGWSEYTPGRDWSMTCSKNKWEFDSIMDGVEQFSKVLNTANDCDEFIERKEK